MSRQGFITVRLSSQFLVSSFWFLVEHLSVGVKVMPVGLLPAFFAVEEGLDFGS